MAVLVDFVGMAGVENYENALKEQQQRCKEQTHEAALRDLKSIVFVAIT